MSSNQRVPEDPNSMPPGAQTYVAYSENGEVTIHGDAVGRDKIVFGTDPETDLKLHLDSLSASIWNDNSFRHTSAIALYVDLLSDAMRPYDTTKPARFYVSELLVTTPRLILTAPRQGGKSLAIAHHSYTLCTNQENSAIPILLDARGDFGAWLSSASDVSVASFSNWLEGYMGLRLRDIRRWKRPPKFMWDHLYLLSPEIQSSVPGLVRSLDQWFDHTEHVITSRPYTGSHANPPGFTYAAILPPNPELARQIVYARNVALEFPTTSVRTKANQTPGELISDNLPQSEVVPEDEVSGYLRDLNMTPAISDGFRTAIPKLAWRLLKAEPIGITYYQAMDILTDGDKEKGAAADLVLSTLARKGFLTQDGQRYRAGNIEIAWSLASDAFERTELFPFITERPASMGELLELCGPQNRDWLAANSRKLFGDTMVVPDRFDHALLRLHLLVSLEELGVSHELIRDELAPAAALAEDLRPEISENHISELESLSRLIARTDTLLAREAAIAFQYLPPQAALVRFPKANGAIEHIDIDMVSGAWTAETPLTLVQFACLVDLLPEQVVREVYTCRPEVWSEATVPMQPVPEHRNDPVVGLTYNGAKLVCLALTQVLSELSDVKITAFLPTMGEWSLLDTGVAPGKELIHGPATPSSPKRPIPVGISGQSTFGISDVYGNVMEWTSTSWGSESLAQPGFASIYEPSGEHDTDDRQSVYRLLRGGSWLFCEGGPTCACVLPPDVPYPDVGMRPFLRIEGPWQDAQDGGRIELKFSELGETGIRGGSSARY
ncbi:formylglycine-generating enzyme family protein [Nostocoides veronense]|uniref:Sulfatase-modifying factor enzyme-like domain-containing protein n=1 Tax=Nostocoides veronense TaxID=330836 RepID=A0ABN2LDQ2_9MICO